MPFILFLDFLNYNLLDIGETLHLYDRQVVPYKTSLPKSKWKEVKQIIWIHLNCVELAKFSNIYNFLLY